MTDAELRQRLVAQMEANAAFIVYQGTAPAWDATARVMRTPAPGRLWDDVAPGWMEGKETQLPCLIGWGESSAGGVGIRFAATGLAEYVSVPATMSAPAWAVRHQIIDAANKDEEATRQLLMEGWVGWGWPTTD